MLATGRIYTAFPEGHYQRKVNFDDSQKDPGGATVEAKSDFHPNIHIFPSSYSFNAEFSLNSNLFEIVIYLYQRVDIPKPMDLNKYINENPNIIKEVMFHALPHASKIIYGLVLNMGYKAEERTIEEQLRDCINKLEKHQVH